MDIDVASEHHRDLCVHGSRFMQVGSISNVSFRPAVSADSVDRVKQSFQKLGDALASGNLSDAKKALTELQSNGPPRTGSASDPLATVSKALDSGDLKAAQAAYKDIQQSISQHASAAGDQARRSSGPSPGGAHAGGAKGSSNAGSSSNSNKVYDKKDTNKDGNVSMQEETAYDLKFPSETKTTSGAANDSVSAGSIDVSA